MAEDTCIFCRIIKRQIPSRVVLENDNVLAFEDIKPQAPVHVLVIPKVHIAKVNELSGENAHLVWEMVRAAKDIAKEKGVQESGYRIVLNCNKDAGQEVFHIHLHLLGGRKFAWPPG